MEIKELVIGQSYANRVNRYTVTELAEGKAQVLYEDGTTGELDVARQLKIIWNMALEARVTPVPELASTAGTPRMELGKARQEELVELATELGYDHVNGIYNKHINPRAEVMLGLSSGQELQYLLRVLGIPQKHPGVIHPRKKR